jgi:hypothetical protein
MRNKRGQIFSGILVLITLLMCGISIMVYLNQQEEVQSSLVSPLAVLELRDSKVIFEMSERELILNSLDSVSSDFGSDEFLSELRDSVVLGLSPEMRDFIFSDFAFNGEIVKGDFNRDDFLRNIVYGERSFVYDGSSGVRFKRGNIEKSFELEALNISKNNFVVGVDFVFSDEYLFRRFGGTWIE